MSAKQAFARGVALGRRRGVPGLMAAIVVAAGTLASGAPRESLPEPSSIPDARAMQVPGGKWALARLVGDLDKDPARFAGSLNRVLLQVIDEQDRWEGVPLRVAVLEHVRLVREIERAFGSDIRLVGSTTFAGRFQSLADLLGYRVMERPDGPFLAPKEGERWETTRTTARALGWDLTEVARRLRAEETVELLLYHDDVESPLPYEEWSAIAGEAVARETGLESLARDQRLGLLIEGLRHVSSETARTLREGGLLPWIHDEASSRFFRYAPSLEVRDGNLVVPGGASAAEPWAAIVGGDPGNPTRFLRALLHPSSERALHLWFGLHFAPDGVVNVYARHLERLHDETGALDSSAALSRARGEGPGFDTLVRALPVDARSGSLDLPGGPLLWLAAIRGDVDPDNEKAIARLVEKAGAEQADGADFLRQCFRVEAAAAGGQRTALTRLVEAANVFHDRPELLTPENVLLLARATERYPMALRSLMLLDLERPESVGEYLRAVAHLDGLDHGPDKFVLVSVFQGGVELLRTLALGGRLDRDVLEARFREWSSLHLTSRDPFQAAPAQLAWLDEVLHALPPADDGAPGRGPLERALLAALAPRHDPQSFEWSGLAYEGGRGLDLARKMDEHLVRQGIPPADALIRLRRGLEELRNVCAGEDLAAAIPLASRLREEIEALPDGGVGPLAGGDRLRPWFEPVDRPRAIEKLREVARVDRSARLPRMVPAVDEAERLLARDLRAFFLAPAYLEGMGELDSLLFREVHLIRRHTPIHHVEAPRPVPADSPWSRTEFIPRATSGIGSHFSGHLSGVGPALQEFHVAGSASESRPGVLALRRAAFRDALSTPWFALETEVGRKVLLLVEAGTSILDRARADRVARDFVSRRIPAARLEQWSSRPVSSYPVSERFLLGLAALAGDDFGPPAPGVLPAGTRASILGDGASGGGDLAGLLAVVGAPTPSINGRADRWVGTWPPFEALENQGGPAALMERERVELRLTVAAYLGRRHLPGEVGADLYLRALEDMSVAFKPETPRDWESYVAWVGSLDDAYFDARMRECLTEGLYRLRAF